MLPRSALPQTSPFRTTQAPEAKTTSYERNSKDPLIVMIAGHQDPVSNERHWALHEKTSKEGTKDLKEGITCSNTSKEAGNYPEW